MNFSPSSVSDAGIMDANAESPPPASEVEIELTYDRLLMPKTPLPLNSALIKISIPQVEDPMYSFEIVAAAAAAFRLN